MPRLHLPHYRAIKCRPTSLARYFAARYYCSDTATGEDAAFAARFDAAVAVAWRLASMLVMSCGDRLR